MKLRSILATDCGSTTTKAILIEYIDGEYRLTYRGEAPTTVEAPFEDVTRGVLNAAMEVEELSGRKILDDDSIITPQKGDSGVDIYISTSSAGGGLQMMVAGVVKSMSGESAERAALGAAGRSRGGRGGRFPRDVAGAPAGQTVVVQVVEEKSGEVLYTVRTRGGRFQPRVYSKGKHTVKIGPQKPDTKTLAGLEPKPKSAAGKLNVSA